ncbi:MAG: glutamate-5-semialdehyde dehydrogenase [Clostridiales bacterium]|nr:glutamate-5-semialdehyde dehydrogenase [Clostridiales bacterium]
MTNKEDRKAAVYALGARAKEAAARMALLGPAEKNRLLTRMAAALRDGSLDILEDNALDVRAAKSKGLTAAFIDRLTLTPARVEDMAKGLEDLAALKDPLGEVQGGWIGAQGIEITRVCVPLGVVGMIYEARPNVTADAAGICFKTGNAVILRGSSEAKKSNKAIVDILARTLRWEGGPEDAILLLADTSRAAAAELMRMNRYLDVLIPRGGAGLIQTVVREATVPVIETGIGNCHVYVDASADLGSALDILINAKTQRPGVCNAAESLLVHRDIAAEFLPAAGKALEASGVELRACTESIRYLEGAKAATEEDYGAEFLDMIISVKVVDGLDEAINHINTYGTKHTEAIITRDYEAARRFTRRIDAAVVLVNASTRFTDGSMFGFGAEIGISTQKLHARGPMGLEEMTTYRYIVQGDGQVRL